MPGGFPVGLDICNGNSTDPSLFALLGLGARLTAHASANTKGSYTTLISSSSVDACWIEVSIAYYASTGTSCGVDIAVGAGGSEVIIFPNLIAGCAFGNGVMTYTYAFPCSIPAGTRIAGRVQSNVGGDDGIFVSARMYDGAFSQMEGAAGLDAMGFNTATSLGTAVTAGTATKGSYAQITSSTARDYMGLMIAIDGQGTSNGGADYWQMFDIAIGGSGSEVVIVPNYQASYNYGWIGPGVSSFLPIWIPAGTRLAARSADATNSSPILGVTIYGVYS